MKILHILNESLPSLAGYTIRSASIVRFQAELGLEPVVVTSPHHEPAPTADVEMIDGIRHYRSVPCRGHRVPFLHEARMVRRMTARIIEVVEIERPDILHAHSPCLWGQAAARAARRCGLPFVYEIRGFWEDAAVDMGKTRPGSLRYRLSRALETRVARSADVVTTIAEHLKEDLVRRGLDERRIMLVPNGVDADRFRPLQPDASLRSAWGLDGCIAIGYVGTLFPWEGVEDLVQVVPAILRGAPQARFLIIGTGRQEGPIRRLIEQLHLADYVRFVGKVPHEDVLRYYSILDVLVYPRKSTRNTELVTPLKPLEAMAMEKAVLGSDVGGIRELLVAGTGSLYRAGNLADLAARCIELAKDPRRREALRKNARSHVVAARNWKTLAAVYVDVYSIATQAKRCPAPRDVAEAESGLTEPITVDSAT